MNKNTLASFCGPGQSVSEPNPAAFSLWLRVHLDAIPQGQDAISLFVQIGDSQIATKISESKNASHLTGEHITLSVPEAQYIEALKHLTIFGCGVLTLEEATFLSVWVEDKLVGFLTVKKTTHA